MSNINHLIKYTAFVSGGAVLAVAPVLYIGVSGKAAYSYLFSVPFGMLFFILQSKSIGYFFSGRVSSAYIIMVLLRLACFGIFLYVILVILKFSPLSTVFGLVTPVFCACVVVLFSKELD